MAITLRKVKQIKVEGEREKGKEMIDRHEIVSPKWRTRNYGHFSRDWNKNYFVSKREINLK